MPDHRLLDERSLAFARLALARMETDATILPHAQANVERWLRTAAPSVRPTLREWQALLTGPRPELVAVLTGRDERSTRLRQSSPFAGIFTNAERTRLIRSFSAREPARP